MNPQAVPATPEPTVSIRPNIEPGQPTVKATPLPTLVPSNPDAPVSNETPLTPAPIVNRTQIRGRITDSVGNPIARARITVPRASQPVPEMAYLSNANGEYVLSVPHGEYTLAVNADGFTPQEKSIETKTEAVLTVDWVLK